MLKGKCCEGICAAHKAAFNAKKGLPPSCSFQVAFFAYFFTEQPSPDAAPCICCMFRYVSTVKYHQLCCCTSTLLPAGPPTLSITIMDIPFVGQIPNSAGKLALWGVKMMFGKRYFILLTAGLWLGKRFIWGSATGSAAASAQPEGHAVAQTAQDQQQQQQHGQLSGQEQQQQHSYHDGYPVGRPLTAAEAQELHMLQTGQYAAVAQGIPVTCVN